MLDLSIIILNYNTKDLVLSCIDSVKEEYKKEFENEQFEIIVVDNNSSDDSLQALRKIKFKGFNLIESNENLGFSNGCNLGAKEANGEYLLFLNSDTQIKDQGFLKMLSFLRERPEIGILGGKLKNDDGTSQDSVGKFYTLLNLFLFIWLEHFVKLRQSPNIIKKVDWVSGACMMVRKSTFEKVGGFEKDIFMYVEDMELCYKANKKGLATYFFPEIMLYHKSLGSSNRAFAIEHIYKGILFFYKKHKSKTEFFVANLILKSKAFTLVVFGQIVNNKYLKDTYSKVLKI